MRFAVLLLLIWERRGKVEAAFAFDAIENGPVEHLALDAVEDLHARHGRLPVLDG
jgi:hypothetical protein